MNDLILLFNIFLSNKKWVLITKLKPHIFWNICLIGRRIIQRRLKLNSLIMNYYESIPQHRLFSHKNSLIRNREILSKNP